MEFQKYNVKKKKKKNKERKQTNQQKQCRKNYKENTGTKLISNTKKHKLKKEFGIADIQCYIKEEEKETEGKKSHRNYKKKL